MPHLLRVDWLNVVPIVAALVATLLAIFNSSADRQQRGLKRLGSRQILALIVALAAFGANWWREARVADIERQAEQIRQSRQQIAHLGIRRAVAELTDWFFPLFSEKRDTGDAAPLAPRSALDLLQVAKLQGYDIRSYLRPDMQFLVPNDSTSVAELLQQAAVKADAGLAENLQVYASSLHPDVVASVEDLRRNDFVRRELLRLNTRIQANAHLAVVPFEFVQRSTTGLDPSYEEFWTLVHRLDQLTRP